MYLLTGRCLLKNSVMLQHCWVWNSAITSNYFAARFCSDFFGEIGGRFKEMMFGSIFCFFGQI